VFAALAVARLIEAETGLSIRKFVKTARRYREATIQAGDQTVTAANPYRQTSGQPRRHEPRRRCALA
jgi:hypothetical protein